MSLDELLVEAGAELDRLSHGHVPHRSGTRDATARRWAGIAAALALVGTVVGVFALVRQPNDSSTVATIPSVEEASTTAVPTTATPTTVAPTTTAGVETPALARTLTKGMSGDDVMMVQQRLADRGFFVGPVDGVFGDEMQQAVWAFKTLIGGMTPVDLSASATATAVTPEVWAQMSGPFKMTAHRPQGDGSTHVEIYLPQQVLTVFTDDEPVLVTHISSGALDETGQPQAYCETATYDTDENGAPLDPPIEQAICSDSKTPGGVFRVTRTYEGKRFTPLGGMYKPVFFNYGIAVHGAENVPTERVSHGAVRISIAAADAFFDLVDLRDDVFVWGEDGRDPELYTRAESLPSFNRPEI